MREDDVVFSAAKLFFSYGLGNALTFPISVGASAVLLPRAADAAGGVRRCAAIGRRSSTACRRCTRRCSPTRDRRPAPAPTACGSASRPARRCPRISASAGAQVVGIDILDGIGSTEMLQIFLSNRPGDIRYGSTGKPVPGYELKIVDEDGQRASPTARSASCGARPDRGRRLLEPAREEPPHLRGRMDPHRRQISSATRDGYYHYCGRTDDMFKVSGMWVSPFEVEAALASHEAVLEAAVDRQGGRRRPDQAEGLHRAQERLCRRRAAARDAARAREGARRRRGNIRAGSISGPICRARRRAKSSASSCGIDGRCHAVAGVPCRSPKDARAEASTVSTRAGRT